MSFVPSLLISKEDLEKSITKLENENTKQSKYLITTNIYSEVLTIKGTEMVICHPKLSKFNESIRNILWDLDIEHQLIL